MPNPEITPDQIKALNERFDQSHPREIITWAAETFGNDLVMTSSFGADSMCTVHLATQVKPDIRVVVINTGFLFPETLAFMEEMRKLYNLTILEYRTRNDPLVWLSVNGEPDPRIRNNVEACCGANKDEVIDRAMREIAPAAWLRGVRADQTQERSKMSVLQWSPRHKCWALSPILRWSNRDVFRYMKENELPHHPLWDLGYTSIGCNPETCTRPVGTDEDARAGRWSGTSKKECGIHLDLGLGI